MLTAKGFEQAHRAMAAEWGVLAVLPKDLWNRWDMWRYAPLMPLRDEEVPVSLGEGATPLLDVPTIAAELGLKRVWVKEEGLNPTGSFKARGMSAAVTRAP